MAKDKISRQYNGEKIKITKDEYDKIEKLFKEINRKVDPDILSYSIDHIAKHVSIWTHYWEGITFESPQFPGILGFKGIRDGMGYHICYKEFSHINSTLTSKNLISNYPVYISAGNQMMFIYLDIIHHQIVDDSKAPLLRVIDTNRRVKNGYVCSIEPIHRKVFSNLDYKTLLVNNIQSIEVKLRTETSRLVPFAGGGEEVVLTLKFQKFSD